jgi:glycosyltransferase involved in cell wall biosynthesis
MKKIKVLHITNLYPTMDNVAYGTFIKEQIDSLSSIGIECEIVFINAQKNGRLQYFKKIKEIRKRAKKFDLLHCHHTYSAFITIFFARPFQPVLTSFLGPGGKEGKSSRFYHLKKAIFNYVTRQSNAFIVKDNPTLNLTQFKKANYIPNGVSLSFFREIAMQKACQKLKIKQRNYILFCSSSNHLRPEKRYDIFKETIRILRDIYHQDVAELILMNQPRNLVPLYFNASRVHLLTSDYEGSPNSVKEALACNIPVVSTDVGNVNLMLKGIEGCYVSAHNDPNELAFLVNESLKYRRIKGRERIIDLKLDLKSIAHKIGKIYTHLLTGKL